jgi:hypothetical protein
MDKYGHTAAKVCDISGPGSIHKPNEEKVTKKSKYINHQWCQEVTLSKQEGLRSIIESKTID